MSNVAVLWQLTFGETVAAGALQALFTAAFVTFGAAVLLQRMETRRADRWRDEDETRAENARGLEAQRADEQRTLSEEHDRRQQTIQLEFESQTALRESYARLLRVQRQSRQASLVLSTAPSEQRAKAQSEAFAAHDELIGEYHRLALDADRPMWVELRRLRKGLDVLLASAAAGDVGRCEELVEYARKARQNLEGRFRERLRHERLQAHYELPDLKEP